jgi:hypothetical protein
VIQLIAHSYYAKQIKQITEESIRENPQLTGTDPDEDIVDTMLNLGGAVN